MYELKGNKPLELLRWLLSTIDGQWLMKTSAAYGPGDALKLSSKVRSAFGKTEMKAMLALIGKSKADNLADSIEIVETYLTLVYGERGWVGSFRQTGGNNAGLDRIEIEVAKCGALDNLKKATSGTTSGTANGSEGLALACEMMWNSWFEVLLPEWQIEVTSQFAGTNGRATDLYTVSCFPQDFEVEVPSLEAVSTPPPVPLQALPEPISPIAAALQMVEEPPAAPVNLDYTSYTPPIQAAPPVSQNNPWPPAPSRTSLAPIAPANTPPQGKSLAERMANKRAIQTPEPAPQFTPEPPAPAPPPALRYDLKSGQALYAKDYDKEAKENVERTERKRNKIMQKLFISKEARQLMEGGGDKPLMPEFSLAAGIESVLQQLIAQENTLLPGSITEQVHVVSGADGELQIHVGTRVYSAVGDVPPGRIRELLQTSVERWGETQGF